MCTAARSFSSAPAQAATARKAREGGSPGPHIVDTGLSLVEIAATVEQGRGVMPPALVFGQEQADVVAYVISISSR
ncbi:MAG: c-type cytochrome [Gaiellaceae bacterium]